MNKVRLHLKENSYDIIIGNRILAQLGDILATLNIGQDAVIVTNPGIARLHGNKLVSGIKRNGFTVKVLTVPDGEKTKSARTAFALIEKITAYDVNRKIFLIALGG